MTDQDAIMNIEVNEGVSDELYVQSVQQLVDSGTIWSLQGSYQRILSSLIASGQVTVTI